MSGTSGTSSNRYAHPGHDRIAREFSELRQREEELRGRWKQMGFEVPQVCSDNETPFSLPEPIPVMHDSSARADDSTSFNCASPAPDEDSISSTSSVTAASNSLSAVKVRPFEDPDSINDHVKFTYFPADETPIQREIKLAREREDTLRQSRGLAPKTADDRSINDDGRRASASQQPSTAEVDVQAGTENSRAASGRVSMRQLASIRLAAELERERQRELDLRRLGCINTISEERSIAADDAELWHPEARSSMDRSADDDSARSDDFLRRRLPTTELIEKEVRDLELREKELRKQRVGPNGVAGDDTDTDDIVNVFRLNGTTSSSEDNVRQQRRRSTLIDQWEKMTMKDPSN